MSTEAPYAEHSKIGICTLAPRRRWQDVGICRACLEQGLFDALVAARQKEQES